MGLKSYYLDAREDIGAIVPEGILSMLEIGCSAGLLGKELKRKAALKGMEMRVTGIEVNVDAVKEAKKNINKVFSGDVEIDEFPLSKNYFDCMICADVLEHLKDPEQFLRKYKAY